MQEVTPSWSCTIGCHMRFSLQIYWLRKAFQANTMIQGAPNPELRLKVLITWMIISQSDPLRGSPSRFITSAKSFSTSPCSCNGSYPCWVSDISIASALSMLLWFINTNSGFHNCSLLWWWIRRQPADLRVGNGMPTMVLDFTSIALFPILRATRLDSKVRITKVYFRFPMLWGESHVTRGLLPMWCVRDSKHGPFSIISVGDASYR